METILWNKAYARPGQLLSDHAKNVSTIAALYGSKIGLAELMRYIGFWHDYGKITVEFQNYIKPSNENKRGHVKHSIYGAKHAYANKISIPLIAEIVSNVVASHHGSLYDNISPDGNTPILDRMATTEYLSLATDCPDIDINVMKSELQSILSLIPTKDKPFYISMLIKFVYSCLIDADRLDAYFSESGDSYSNDKPDWSMLLEKLTCKLEAYKIHSEMDLLRKRVSESCLRSGSRDIGIYKLAAPTGSGKTLSSLRFALEHARLHNMDRIIYIIPYLSIISQTASEIRTVLNENDNVVLEHHSNFLADHPENYKLHTDRWDAPIIITTQVQFLESIFSASGSDLRKFHNMSRSILIFDEVQSLPIKCIHLFNEAIEFLHNVCECTILLCTATQPLLDTVKRPIVFSPNPSIAVSDAAPTLYNVVNSIIPGGYSYPELASFVIEKHNKSTLIIVNTKNAAKALHEVLIKNDILALHLSTNMCPAHRDHVISELRRRLDAGEPVICISTQLIEAGVNISLECVIREVAGLDSVLQAAGRCNRHGEYNEIKSVYIINIKGSNLSKLPDIKIGAETTQRLLAEGVIDINLYYKYFFYQRQNIMDYPTRGGGTIYDLLSENIQGCGAYKPRTDKRQEASPPALRSAIRSASEEFYVIDRGRTDIIVPYGDGEELVSQYTAENNIVMKRKLLRAISKYSVSMYKYQIDELSKRGALYNNEGLIVLSRGFYNAERGVDFEGAHEFLYI